MRTRLGEITIGKVIIALLLITVATLFFSETGGNILHLSFENYFLGFSFYIGGWITGFFIRLLDFSRKLNVPGFGVTTDDDEKILKIKEEGYFIYHRGSGENPKKNECRHLNTNVVTSMDRIFYTSGPPFGETWEFESGVVHWFGMIPLMGLAFLAVFVLIPLGIILLAYNFFW